MSEPEQIDELAAALRADTADLTVYARVLTNALADALPAGLVTITRDRSFGDRLAGREGTVQSLAIRLGDHEFTLHQRRGGAPKAVASQQVRGVTISSRETSLDEWIHQLAAALTDYAGQSAEARDALAKLLGTT